MLATKNLVIGVKILLKFSWIQSLSAGLNPIVNNITIVIKRKAEKPISTFCLAFSLPKYSDKISVHKNVEANKTVPSATGAGE